MKIDWDSDLERLVVQGTRPEIRGLYDFLVGKSEGVSPKVEFIRAYEAYTRK